MRRKVASRAAVVAILLGLLVGLVPGASASTSSDYASLQQKIAQTRAKIRAVRAREKAILTQIAASDRRRMSLERGLDALTDQLTLATRQLEVLQLQRDQAAVELELKSRELEDTYARLHEQTSQLQQKAAALYMAGPTAYGAVLFGSTDFHSYVSGLKYAEDVLHVDLDALDQIRDLKSVIEKDRADLQARQDTLDVQARQITAQQNRLAALRAKQAGARSAVVGEIAAKQRILATVQSQREAYAAALQNLLEESNSIAEMLRRAQYGQHAIQGKGGYLKWPVSGPITSEYGWRIHPIYGYKSFHTGIDIGAPSGTTVKAARYGEVLFVGYKGAYGLVVIIDHGNALATIYAHLSKAYVSAGQAVSTLSSVGAVGCTGWCTGPHLHFEVRVNGEHQNPHLWL